MSERFVVELRAALSADPRQVAVARRLLRGYLADDVEAPADTFDVPELLVSELVTNAILHGGPPVELHAASNGAGIRVEVRDGVPRPPVLESSTTCTGAPREHGRGLQMVATLADRWGWDGHPTGKTVWFELDCL